MFCRSLLKSLSGLMAIFSLTCLFETTSESIMAADPVATQRTQMAKELWKQAITLSESGELKRAVSVAEKAFAEDRRQGLNESLETLQELNWIAGLCELAESFDRAETKRRDALRVATRLFGKDHYRVRDMYLALSDVQRLQKLTAEQREELSHVQHLENESLTLFNQHSFSEALPKARECIRRRKRVLGKSHRSVVVSMSNLGTMLLVMGEFADAAEIFQDALGITGEIFGTKHPYYATVQNNIGQTHASLNNHHKAISLFESSLQILALTSGVDDISYAATLSNLGNTYLECAEFDAAERLLRKAVDVVQKNGLDVELCTPLCNLASFFQVVGDYDEAAAIYRKAIEVREKQGHQDFLFATMLGNLAAIHQHQGDYARALSLLKRAGMIQERLGGSEHPNFIGTLNATGAVLLAESRYTDAIDYFRRAVTKLKRRKALTDRVYWSSLHNWALAVQLEGDFVQAEALFGKAETAIREAVGDESLEYVNLLGSMSRLDFQTGNMQRAVERQIKCCRLCREVTDRAAVVLSERQQLAMGRMLRDNLDSLISLALATGQHHEEAAHEILAWKGATLVRQRAIRATAEEPEIASRFQQLQQVARELASTSRVQTGTEVTDGTRKQTLVQLRRRLEKLETELSRDSLAFRTIRNTVSMEQLQAALPSGAVLLDFLEFTDVSFVDGKWGSVPSFVVVIVEQKKPPRLIELGASSIIAEQVKIWRQSFGISSRSNNAGQHLRRLIWEPLQPFLEREELLLISPDGILGQLPFGALPGEGLGTYLLEDHRLTMISIPQLLPSLIGETSAKSPTRNLLLMGDVDYDALPLSDSVRKKRWRVRGAGNVSFSRLTGTAGEVATLEVLYRDLFETSDGDLVTLKRRTATESQFRELAPQFRHIHLATHGFFESGKPTMSSVTMDAQRWSGMRAALVGPDQITTGWNPSLLSGLAFAGANRSPDSNYDDGLMTAQEIMFLPLNGVETVVLSACETGLGEAVGGEGLLGVQRAFQVAGVRATIATLWKIDDLVTRRLMERFYRNLWEKEMSRLDALRETQLWILNNPESIRGINRINDGDSTRASPYYWAAFQLSGDWR